MKYVAHWDAHTERTARRNKHWAVSDRGWLFVNGEETSVGHYLDYGPEHHRSSHEYCRTECTCELAQKGMVHAVRVATRESRYFPTPQAAMEWIEAARPEIAPEQIRRSGPVFAEIAQQHALEDAAVEHAERQIEDAHYFGAQR
jgi:hypothetical protein